MKRIFSNLLLFVLYPVRIIKRSKIDNFVFGAIFGAIFSLLVNLITVQIQEDVNRQRIFEGIENEIVTNTLGASNIVTYSEKLITDKKDADRFYNFKSFSRDLWEQSPDAPKYIAQLDQLSQIKLGTYYTHVVPFTNDLQKKIEREYDKTMMSCFKDLPTTIPLTKEEQLDCNTKFYFILKLEERSSAKFIADSGFDLLKIFHPTKDRLNSFWLRLLMGDKSTRILSGH